MKEKNRLNTHIIFSSILIIFLLALGSILLLTQNQNTSAAASVLNIELNGGRLNDFESDFVMASTQTGETFQVDVPTKSGYKFAGWGLANGEASISTFGKLIYQDPFLEAAGASNLHVYNNLYNDTVQISIEPTGQSLEWKNQKNIAKFSVSGEAAPGLGGFRHMLQSRSGALFYQVIVAKIPIGYRICWESDPIGNGSYQQFLTNQEGTGDWQVYVVKRQCGNSGSFQETGYIYIDGPTATVSLPVEWYIAYAGAYDATGLNVSEEIAAPVSVKMTNSSSTIRALWVKDTWTSDTSYAQKPDGKGTQAEPYLIQKAENLAYFAQFPQSSTKTHMKFINDIDLSEHEWTPISSENDAGFDINGNNHSIQNLKILQPDNFYLGLFGKVYSLTVYDLKLGNVDISGRNHMGSFAGHAESLSLRNCHVSGFLCGQYILGSFAGYSAALSANNCTNTASIYGKDYYIGGIIGYAVNSTLDKCNNFGNIYGKYYLGGIVGYSDRSSINACLVECMIQGEHTIGGIAGDCHLIMESAFRGTINIISTETELIAGICATKGKYEYSENIISDCFADAIIYFVKSDSVDSLNTMGCEYNTSITSSYINYKIIEAKKIVDIKYFCVGGEAAEPFTNWVYHNALNKGLPIPKVLLGNIENLNTDVMSHLKNLDFVESST